MRGQETSPENAAAGMMKVGKKNRIEFYLLGFGLTRACGIKFYRAELKSMKFLAVIGFVSGPILN
jgi:hypothetical protein